VTAPILIVSQALIQHQDGVSLHPDLFLWQKQLAGYRRSWFDCTDKTPLGWYAALCGCAPAALLAARCNTLPGDCVQCWVVSPYHAQIMRDAVRVLPEGQMPWTEADARWLCDTLNPLLAEEGMQLHSIGAALLLSCRDTIEAWPQGFGAISGWLLPDRHHEGADGGRLNRLLSEIQMTLFQHPSLSRHERGEPDVNGIWLWSPVAWPPGDAQAQPAITVATRNPALQGVADARDARCMISEAERLEMLLQRDAPLPKRILLAGEGYALWLQKSWLPGFGRQAWSPAPAPDHCPDEAALLMQLRRSIA